MRSLHAMVRVGDLEKVLDFYVGKLGLEEVYRYNDVVQSGNLMGLEDMFKRNPDKSSGKMKEAEGALGEMEATAKALEIELQELAGVRRAGHDMPKAEQNEIDPLLLEGEQILRDLNGLLKNPLTETQFKEGETESRAESFLHPNPRASSLKESAGQANALLRLLRERKARLGNTGSE